MPRFPKSRDRKPRYGGAPKWKKPRAGKSNRAEAADGLVRLQKVLAAAGIGSRRQCEELIREGRVDVDGKTISELGTRVDPRQKIRVDGEPVRRPKRVYFAVNKPIGILATTNDPSGRPRVIDLAPSNERLFNVGRLDKSSEGLILVTNDGELTDLLTHPRYGVEKTYLAQVVGVPTVESLNRLRRGVHFSEGYAHAKEVRVRRTQKQSSVLEIVLDEGRNREVRRLLAKIGHKVLRLQRVAIGPLRLGTLKAGESRLLGQDEVAELYHAAKEGRKKKRAAARIASAAGNKLAKSAAEPLIDYSVPQGEEADANWAVSEDEPLTYKLTDGAVGEDAAEMGGGDLGEDESLLPLTIQGELDDDWDEKDAAKVDLRPIKSPGKQHDKKRTVIGGQRQGSERRPRGGRGRKGKPQGGGKFRTNKQGAANKQGTARRGRRSK